MGDLRAGVGRSDLTPPVGVELCGYGPFLSRRSTGAHDPLSCRALVLDAGQGMVVLIANELIGITADVATQVRYELRQRFGIAEDRVMITCSHTHSGPNTIHLIGWGEPDPDYVRELPEQIVAAVEQAVDSQQPARLGTGCGLLENVARNRVQSDGTGLIDPELTVIRVDSQNGQPLAVVVHFTAHPVTLGPANTLISGDYAGAACTLLEQDLGTGAIALFLNGACGDINVADSVKNADEGFPLVTHYGQQVARAVARIAEQIIGQPAIDLDVRRSTSLLPLSVSSQEQIIAEADNGIGQERTTLLRVAQPHFYQQWCAEMLAKVRSAESHMRAEVQAIRIDDCILAAQPAELFAYFGLLLKQRSPHRRTIVVGYANDYVGYVPRPQDYDDAGFGGYAARLAPKILGNFEFRPTVGMVLTDDMLDLLHML